MSRVDVIPLRRRGVWVFACIAIGVVAAQSSRDRFGLSVPSAAWFAGAALLGVVVLARRGARTRAAAVLALVCLGAGALTARVIEAPQDSLRWSLDETARLAHVSGVVERAPRLVRAQRGPLAAVAAYNPELTRLVVRATSVVDDDGVERSATGSLYVRVDEPMAVWPAPESLAVGDRVRMTGFVTALRGPLNPGERDARPRASQQGVAGSMRLARAALIEREPGPLTMVAQLRRWRDATRAHSLRVIEGGGLFDDGASVLGALLLGERDPVESFDVESAFRRVGVAHVLAISGLHVGMVVFMVVVVARLPGDYPWLQWGLVALVILAMALLIPARAPILRAVLIAGSVVLADVAGRRYDRLNMLALVAAALLLVRPLDLFDPGYQLSFGVVAGLIWLGPGVAARWVPIAGAGLLHRAWRWLVQALVASLIAWSVATPLLAYHFGLVSPLAVVSSVLAAPLVAAALVCGYVGLLVMIVWPALGTVGLGAARGASAGLVDLVMAMDELPGIAMRVPTVGLPATAAALVLVVCWWRVVARPVLPSMVVDLGKRQLRTSGLIAASLGCALWIWVEWSRGTRLQRDVALRVDTLAVGDGSAHLIRAGNDALLFDCGSSWYSVGQRTIPDALRALGAWRVPRVVISHADIDHFSGLLDAADLLGLREVMVTEQFLRAAKDPGTHASLLIEGLRERRVTVLALEAGDRFELDGIHVVVLHPMAGDDFERDNAASMVLDIEVPTDGGPRRVMFFGDLDGAGLAAFRSRHDATLFRPDVIEAPHHGSAQAASIAFVRALGPRVILQSTGPSRLDDERWDEVRAQCAWWSTARGGAISAEVLRSGAVRVHQPMGKPIDGGARSP